VKIERHHLLDSRGDSGELIIGPLIEIRLNPDRNEKPPRALRPQRLPTAMYEAVNGELRSEKMRLAPGR
jgi:hypothetical protein